MSEVEQNGGLSVGRSAGTSDGQLGVARALRRPRRAADSRAAAADVLASARRRDAVSTNQYF